MVASMTDEPTWDLIIDAISGDAPGGLTEAAAALGQLTSVVSGWRTRGIPPGHWPAVVALAAGRGNLITLEMLAELAARKLERVRLEKARKIDEARA
jgi:hypothetical protein